MRPSMKKAAVEAKARVIEAFPHPTPNPQAHRRIRWISTHTPALIAICSGPQTLIHSHLLRPLARASTQFARARTRFGVRAQLLGNGLHTLRTLFKRSNPHHVQTLKIHTHRRLFRPSVPQSARGRSHGGGCGCCGAIMRIPGTHPGAQSPVKAPRARHTGRSVGGALWRLCRHLALTLSDLAERVSRLEATLLSERDDYKRRLDYALGERWKRDEMLQQQRRWWFRG